MPFFRAIDRPIAIACFRLFTVLPLLPLFKRPRLYSRISRSTSLDAAREYLLAMRAKTEQHLHAAQDARGFPQHQTSIGQATALLALLLLLLTELVFVG